MPRSGLMASPRPTTGLALFVALAVAAPAHGDNITGSPGLSARPRTVEEEVTPPPVSRPRPPSLWPVSTHGVAAITDVASSFEPNRRVDVRLTIAYEHEEQRGQLKREVNNAIANQDTVLLFRDLAFARSRDLLGLRADVGLYRDLGLHVALPIVLHDQTRFGFDRSADPCTLPPTPNATCIDATNSNTVGDGIAPATGYDATRSGAPTAAPTVFRGARRGAIGGSGADALDTINFGLTWAPFSQRRDPTKPTWVLAFEPQISIGTIQAFDRATPDANHGVSEGIHRLAFRTAVSRRVGRFEPYFAIQYRLPIARSGSAFIDYGPTETIKNPQHDALAIVGTEIVAYERGRPDWKVVIDARARLEGHFAGRGYSEAWELFAGSPALRCDEMLNPACDASATKNPYQGHPYTGVTVIEDYATLGLELAVGALLARYLEVRLGFGYAREQSHLITGDDVGIPMSPGGRVTQATEYNPAYRGVIDQVGRRYAVDNVDIFNARFAAQLRF